MLDLYLRELGRELSRTLPPEDVALRLAEAEDHLRDGIEGRLELGLGQTEAERETIQAFGAARRFAAASRPTHEGRATARLALIGTGYGLAVAFVSFGWRLMDALPQLNAWLFQSWFVVGAGFAVAAFLARRPRPVAVGGTVLGGAALTALILGGTYLDLYGFGGTGVMPRGDVSRFVSESRKTLAEHEENRAVFDAGWAVVRGPQGVEGLRTAAGYQAPIVQQPSYRTPLQYTSVPDAKTALSAWSDVRQRGTDLFKTEGIEADLRAVESAQAASARNFASILPSLLLPNVGIAALAILIDYAFGGLGTLAFRLRRRRKGPTVA